ncbi:MAG: SRPBCC family protein [Pseudonocardiaceae bacterium]|nr:SRPBCC family protein [Pseudonocardiaceae bacterium]
MTAKPTASAQIEVNASPDQVYELVSDPGKLAEFAEEYSGHSWLGGANGAKVGARFRGNNRKGIARWSTTATVTDAVPGRRFAFDVTAFGFPVSRWQYEIEPTGDGCCVTESTWERRGPALKVVGAFLSGVKDRAEYNRRNIEATLRRLKAHAES